MQGEWVRDINGSSTMSMKQQGKTRYYGVSQGQREDTMNQRKAGLDRMVEVGLVKED